MQKIVRCLLNLPLLPTGEIVQAVNDIRPEIADDGQHVEGLKKLVAYINKQWRQSVPNIVRVQSPSLPLHSSSLPYPHFSHFSSPSPPFP